MGRSTDKETGLSEQRKYRTWTAKQKVAIVLAGLRGDRSVKEVCREHQISDTLYYLWRDKLLEGGLEALAGKEERHGERELRRKVAEGYALAAVARVMQISRQAIYRTPTPRRLPQRRPAADPVEAAIVAEALANQTDGYRMVTAFVRRRLGVAVNRKRVLRVMRERKLIQRRRPLERRKRPGFFRVERPRQLWQLDMTSVWVAEHGWCYLMAMID